MKFPTIAIALALVSGGNGFVAPNTGVSRATALNQSLRNLIINERPRAVSSGSTPAVPEIPLPPAPATPSGSTISKDEVRSLFELWNQALATGDSRIVASRYIEKPCLLPTVSDVPRTDYDSVKDYFDAFLLKEPQGTILEGEIYTGDGWAVDAGIYEFTMGATGDKVKARYSFNYVKENGIWKIQHHHSSVMPEEIAMGKPISDDEVRGLFSLWNNALATLDPKKVANRYSKTGVLLPTVSDTPRTDYASIEDYFTNFLKLKPQGEILESHVTVGKNWCSDVGIYEFNMGATGKKVKGRYTFVYGTLFVWMAKLSSYDRGVG